ncbi:MAG: DNA polymerase III subunit delta [candidate division WOR-3 bacterium]
MSAAILKEIDASRFRPVYLFFGADLTVSDEVIERLKQKLLVPGLESFDYDHFSAAEIGKSEKLSIPLFVQRLRQPPVGAVRRLVVVRHLEQLSGKILSEFASALASVPDTTSVVVVCNADPGRTRDLRRLFRDAGLERWLIAVPGAHNAQLITEVQRWAKAQGLDIDPPTASLLIEIAGEDPVMLKSELEKLATALPAGSGNEHYRLTPDLIRQYASSTRVFELRDYVSQCLERNATAALATLRRLELLGEEPKKIIGWLVPALLDLLAVKLGNRSASSLWRCPGTALRRWQVGELDSALHRLFRIDVSILRGNREIYALLDIWTLSCCRRSR